MKVSQSDSTHSAVGSPDEASTVVAPGTHIVGRLSGQEDVRVHGTIEGRIHLSATLYVEPEGIIAADVHADDVVVAGTVVGNVTAAGSIVLAASARVVGDLRAPRLVVAPGAAFRGQVSMEPPDEDEEETDAEAARDRREGRQWTQAQAQARPAQARPAAPYATQNGVRLPPQRTAPRRDSAIAKPSLARPRLEEQASDPYGEGEEAEWGDSAKRAKKVARPRILARGKHKVERI
ncbi:bactofilin family protein [Nannocystis bainbridge]|uniref:Polymer-forming cytoskeletal protein n=1 Tax=Nannocystis bainbridge TaxID=2995303 RepID=A0ABT5E7S0_9BACT|nr:polymer-forming cytoskeletal protein [Nannocystis bainbridge]MDC0721911.1 polymer-forming cytoskeletal protein [Nannocystis bainbridge]